MKRLKLLCVALVIPLIQGCGQGQPQPISAQDPLYLLVVDGQNLQLNVISRPSYTLSGTIPIDSVGQTPPQGAVSVNPDGSVVVTHTGAFMDRKPTVAPATLWCSLSKRRCTELIHGLGSATAIATSSGVAVPLFNDANVLKGEIARLTGSPPKVTSRVALPALFPGVMQLSRDGHSLYWLTSKPGATGAPVAMLVRFDLDSRQVIATTSFGQQMPSWVDVAGDGSVYVSLIASDQGDKTVGGQPTPAKTINVYTPALSLVRSINVGNSPVQFALGKGANGGLAVAYMGQQRVELYGATPDALVRTIDVPEGNQVAYLSAFPNGDFALLVNGPHGVGLKILNAKLDAGPWHFFAGEAVGAAATGIPPSL